MYCKASSKFVTYVNCAKNGILYGFFTDIHELLKPTFEFNGITDTKGESVYSVDILFIIIYSLIPKFITSFYY